MLEVKENALTPEGKINLFNEILKGENIQIQKGNIKYLNVLLTKISELSKGVLNTGSINNYMKHNNKNYKPELVGMLIDAGFGYL